MNVSLFDSQIVHESFLSGDLNNYDQGDSRPQLIAGEIHGP